VPDPPRPTRNVFVLSLATLRMASRSLVFWVLTFTFFVCGVSSFGLMPHFVTLCGDFGHQPDYLHEHADHDWGVRPVRHAGLGDGCRIGSTIAGCWFAITASVGWHFCGCRTAVFSMFGPVALLRCSMGWTSLRRCHHRCG